MSNAKDLEIVLFKRNKDLTNSQTQEAFSIESYDGYVLYKGRPVLRAKGKRVEDRTYNKKSTGQPFTIKKFYLNFFNGEDTQDDELRQEGTLYVRLEERTNRSKGNTFMTATTDDLWFGKEDKRNTKGLKVGNLLVPLNGIIESYPTVDQWGDLAQRLRLTADNKYSIGLITKDMMSDTKVGYTASTNDELFTPEELDGLAKQFKYFNKFKLAFDGERAEKPEAVVPASF